MLEKVRESQRRLEKVRGSMNKYEKESMGKYGKVRERYLGGGRYW